MEDALQRPFTVNHEQLTMEVNNDIAYHCLAKIHVEHVVFFYIHSQWDDFPWQVLKFFKVVLWPWGQYWGHIFFWQYPDDGHLDAFGSTSYG